MSARRGFGTICILLLALAACSEQVGSAPSDQRSGAAPTTPAESTVDATTAESTVETTTAEATTPEEAKLLCADLEARTVGPVQIETLIEASGAAAGTRNPGLFWVHNDSWRPSSGAEPALFAIDSEGRHRATLLLPLGTEVDVEDLAIADGTIYLADIGDNDSVRDNIAIYRFPEPELRSSGETPPASEAERIALADPIDTIRFTYPDRARDAEALLVDPITGQLAIVEKAFAFGASEEALIGATPAGIYVADPPFDTEAPTELRLAGTVALDQLEALALSESPPDAIFTRLGGAGVATGADIRADGAAIAIRTYTSVWLFARADGQTIAEALAKTPCEAPTIVEEQGEAVAFLLPQAGDDATDGAGAPFATISEGRSPGWNVSS